MKRNVAIIILIVLLSTISLAAFAEEEFSLRNGILFGDTIDDILAKETSLVRKSEVSDWDMKCTPMCGQKYNNKLSSIANIRQV